jgi:hypothetical protein
MIIRKPEQRHPDNYLIVLDDNETELGRVYPDGWFCPPKCRPGYCIMTKYETQSMAIEAIATNTLRR